jgi:hypothetical protein
VAVGVRLRAYILRRDEYRCVYCGAEPDRFYLQVDHVIPKAKSGRTHPANLVTSCAECNLRKSAGSVELSLPLLALLARETHFDWRSLR